LFNVQRGRLVSRPEAGEQELRLFVMLRLSHAFYVPIEELLTNISSR